MPSMEPIGYVRSPYKTTQQIPKGLGATHPAEGTLAIRDELEPGLTDIEGFSHLIVIWEFDRSEGFSLVGKPPTDDRPHWAFLASSRSVGFDLLNFDRHIVRTALKSGLESPASSAHALRAGSTLGTVTSKQDDPSRPSTLLFTRRGSLNG